MSQRNFNELSPYDFEILVADLLQAEWGGIVETFPSGADEGVDIRLLTGKDGKPKFAQCKHSPGKSWSDISNVVKREASVNATRDLREYWFVTSCRLRSKAKDKIVDIFASQELSLERVLGINDLNSRLDNNPDIERRNIKLYLSSVAVLQAVLNNAAYVRQRQYFDAILSNRKYYVESTALVEVQKTLDAQGMCIVSGEPGVGKTTLCEMVALQLMEDGYETFEIKNISEAIDVWRADSRQLFVYDDFLGQTSLTEKLGRLEDQELEKFANNVRKSNNHLLLLSTREYILEAAKKTYPRLDGKTFSASKVIVDVGAYTKFQRAHILYNHVYFSTLDSVARDSLSVRKAYEGILAHGNYNPRLISMIVDEAVSQGGNVASGGFAAFVQLSLENPSELWGGILRSELSEVSRDVLLVLASLPALVSEATLLEATRSYRAAEGKKLSNSEFLDAVRVLEKVFIVSGRNGVANTFALKNPGVRDFVSQYILSRPLLLARLYESSVGPDQIEILLKWAVTPKYGRQSPAWRSLTWDECVRVFDVNRFWAQQLVDAAQLPMVGLTRGYFSKDDTFSLAHFDLDRYILCLINAVADDDDPSLLTSFVLKLWPILKKNWDEGVDPESTAEVFLACAAAMDQAWIRPAAREVDEILSCYMGDSDFEFEKLKALKAIYDEVTMNWESDRLADDCVSQINSAYAELDSTDDEDEIARKIAKIDEMVELFDLAFSEEWDERRDHHLARRRKRLDEGVIRVNRIDEVTPEDDDKIADLFRTLS
jgi:hypothetical protein